MRHQVATGGSIVSPDGEWVVYTRRIVAANQYQTNLWLVPYRGGRPRQLTSGRWKDSAPVFAPDSRTIAAFSSDRGEDQTTTSTRCGSTAARPSGSAGPARVDASARVLAGRPLHRVRGRRRSPRFWSAIPRTEIARRDPCADWRDDSGTLDHRIHLYVVAARPGARRRSSRRATST